jgi:hypothetical protein
MASKKQSKPEKDAAAEREKKAHRAKLACRPSVNSAAVTAEYAGMFGEQGIGELVEELSCRIEKLNDGDMKGIEAMLYGQAHALQSIFVSLARRAAKQEYLKQYGLYLGLALKAQAQCRATLETLAEVKQPKPATFVRQQNVAYQQQVNNGGTTVNRDNETSTHAPARTEKTVNQSNELLSEATHATLDATGTGTSSATDSHLAAVEAVQRR